MEQEWAAYSFSYPLVFSRKPCLLSVIFIRRLQLKKVVAIVNRTFWYRVIDLTESCVYYEFIKLYFLELHLKTFIRTFDTIIDFIFIRIFFIYLSIYLIILLIYFIYLSDIYQIFIRKIFIKIVSGYVCENLLYDL